MVWRCTCEQSKDWCVLHAFDMMEDRFAAPLTKGELSAMLSELGATLHSFRRTWCVAVRLQARDRWCEKHIKRISRALAWAPNSQTFWHYSQDAEAYKKIEFPRIQAEFL